MIQINQLNFAYNRQNPLFKNLNLNMPKGHIYGLLGKNGAGKTTLLKHITGFLYQHSGTAEAMGYPSHQRNPYMLQDIYIIPEEFILPSLSINRYVSINAPFYPSFSHNRLKDYLKEFGLDANKKLSVLSYGQKKKFLLAFGLASNARILLLDEPTNGLDIPSKSQFRKIIASSMQEERSVIISTHQVRDLSNLIDHVIILDEGEIIFYQDTQKIIDTLAFTLVKNDHEVPVIYAEERLEGKYAIVPTEKVQETEIDLELLFNGVTQETEKINESFKN